MKWWKLESMSLYDPKIQALSEKFGPAGYGVYWGILSYLCVHGENFQVRILGLPKTSVEDPEKSVRLSKKSRKDFQKIQKDSLDIPTISVRNLSKFLSCPRKKLLDSIETCVEQKLFDPSKWHDFGVLHSSYLEKSQDDYSKKKERNREGVRTLSGQVPEKVSLQQEQDVEQEQEEEIQNKNAFVDLLKSAFNTEKLTTSDSPATLVPLVSDENIKQFRHLVWEDIQEWNRAEGGNFNWIPSEIEICKLLRGGDPEHKLRLCYQAMNLLGGDATYPRVVRRAVLMMLDASRRKRIKNPFGWLWTCLHGKAGGTTPWVQLATAAEES